MKGSDAFTFYPGLRSPDIGWEHWDGHGVAIGVTNRLRKLYYAGESAVRFWNAAQGRFNLDEAAQERIAVQEYSDDAPPLSVYGDPAFWRSVGGAAALYNAAGQRITGDIADKRTARVEIWLRASAFQGEPWGTRQDPDDDGAEDLEAGNAVRHELGHALGLADVYTDPSWRIMDYADVYQPGASGPTPDDVHSALTVYGDIPWWPAPEEYLADLPSGVVLWYVDPVTGQYVKYDSGAPPYVNTLRGLRHGTLLYAYAEIGVAVKVGRRTVHIPQGQSAIVWPSP